MRSLGMRLRMGSLDLGAVVNWMGQTMGKGEEGTEVGKEMESPSVRLSG